MSNVKVCQFGKSRRKKFPKTRPKTEGKVYKILLMGEGKVGRNSIINIIHPKAASKMQTKVSVPITDLSPENHQINLKLLNSNLTHHTHIFLELEYFKGIIFLFDLTNSSSLPKAELLFTQISEKMKNSKFIKLPKILVGNKSDLKDKREIKFEEGLGLAERLGMDYIEISAFSGTNIFTLLKILGKNIIFLMGKLPV